MDNDTDLTGLNPAEAKEYIYRFILAVKETKAELDKTTANLDLWRNRVMLAESKGLFQLKEEAQAEYSKAEGKTLALASELKSLQSKVEAMKHALPGLAMRERSIDADALLASLEMVTGTQSPSGATDEATWKKTEAESALDALKKKMN